MTDKHNMPDEIDVDADIAAYNARVENEFLDFEIDKHNIDMYQDEYMSPQQHEETIDILERIKAKLAELERVKQSHAELLELLKMPFAHLGDNNFSSEPWWGIVRESKIGVIGQVLLCGPFFSHTQATDELEGRRYRYGPKAITWEFSGYNSGPWKQFYDKAKQAIANAEKVVGNE